MMKPRSKSLLPLLLALIAIIAIATVGTITLLKANNVPAALSAEDMVTLQTIRLELIQIQNRLQPLQMELNLKLRELNVEVERLQVAYDADGCAPDIQGRWDCTERERQAAAGVDEPAPDPAPAQ
jgi:hypothetical protein